MAEAGANPTQNEPNEGRSTFGRALILGLPLALLMGGGAFYAAYSGLVDVPFLSGGGTDMSQVEPSNAEAASPVFLALDPMIVMLGPSAGGRHLRFRASLEVSLGQTESVQASLPRVLDVLNGYLRAVPITEIEAPSALVRLRAQMLRRIQLVTGNGTVRDLLITEFVVN